MMLDEAWIHGPDPQYCYCESRRGCDRIAANEHATRAHLDPIEAVWKAYGKVLFNLPELASSPLWLEMVPLPLMMLALLYEECDRLRRYLLCHSTPPSDAALASCFERWAVQGRVFPQHRVAGSFGSGRG